MSSAYFPELLLTSPMENLKYELSHPENIDLIESGATYAARALSDERLKQISHCVANGIESDQRGKIQNKRLLGVLGDLDDEEIAILHAYGTRDGNQFSKLRPPSAHFNSALEVVRNATMYEAAELKLERLGLTKFDARTVAFEIPPEYKGLRPKKIKVATLGTGGSREGSHRISLLGELLLREIGLLNP